MKLAHIGLPVKDIQKAKFFYDAIASTVGLTPMGSKDDFIGYGEDGSYRLYVHSGKAPVTGLHVCFYVDSLELVNTFYAKALAAGGSDNGAPGVREHYSPTYYAAFVLDPDGNNIETVCKV